MKNSAYEGIIFSSINILCPIIFQILNFEYPEIFRGVGQGIGMMGAVTLLNLFRWFVNPRFRVWYGLIIVANTAAFILFGMISVFLAIYYMLPLIMS